MLQMNSTIGAAPSVDSNVPIISTNILGNMMPQGR
jgi:hypothetical protein